MQFTLLAAVPAAALVLYGLLLLVMMRGKKTFINKVFTLYVAAMVVWSLGSFVMRTGLSPGPLFWNRVLCVGFLAMPVTFYHFSVVFGDCRRQKVFVYVGYAATGIFEVTNFFGGMVSSARLVGSDFVYETGFAAPAFAVIGMLLLFGACYNVILGARARSMSFGETKFILLGISGMAGGGLLNLLPAIGRYPVDLAGAAINGLALSYAIFRYKFLEINVLINRGLVYSSLTIFLTGTYFASVFVAENLLSGYFRVSSNFWAVIMAFVVAALFQPMKNWFQQVIDRLFFPEKLEHHKILQNFNNVVNTIMDTDTLAAEVTRIISGGLGVKQAAFFTGDDSRQVFSLRSLRGFGADPGYRFEFDAGSPIIRELKHRNVVLRNEIEDEYAFKALWEKEKQAVAQMGVFVMLPVKYMNKLVGIISLSKKNNGDIFSQEEMNLLTAMAGSMGLALENARSYSQVKKEAVTDGLTGVYNHRYLQEYLEKELPKAWNQGQVVSILMSDVDMFKLFNDLYGHHSGDQALKYLAALMLEITRGRYVLARHGGEEFAAVLTGVPKNEALRIGENLRQGIEKEFYRLYGKVLTVSVGVAAFPEDGADRESLLMAADKALYYAKSQGRNRTEAYSPELEQGTRGANIIENLESAYMSTMYALSAAIDVKDHYTFGHSKNVSRYGSALAQQVGLSDEEVRNVHYAGLLHDIGKIGVPESVLTKSSALTDDEFFVMRRHVDLSVAIVKHISSFLPIVPIVHCHHERFDGTGYPRSLRGDHIPLEGRILAVVDAYDAMTTDRPYRKGLPAEKALEELRRCSGKQFDPELVKEFISLVHHGMVVKKPDVKFKV